MTDCVILAIASTTQTVRALLQRLVNDVVLDDQASVVPWTIVNKYYTAEVKFLVHTFCSIQDELLAPALLFVWNKGEPYRNHIHKLSQHASQHTLEVALAVRLPQTDSTLSTEIEDDQDVDAYLSSKGFEFVDIQDTEASSLDRSGIPGIPRIVDALSTIMWSSMIRQPSKRATTPDFIGPGISSGDYRNLVQLVGQKISGNDSDRMQRELEELERWFDQDILSSATDAPSTGGEDEVVPWSTVVTPGILSPSSSAFLEDSRPTTPKAGFDDDFTSFVTASPNSAGIPQPSSDSESTLQGLSLLASTSFGSTFNFSSTSSDRSTPIFDDYDGPDMTRLVPGESYKSLGSVSDLGDPDKDSIKLEQSSDGSDDADEGTPSRAEIERGDGIPNTWTSSGNGPDVEITDASFEHFDLQSVLDALQGLKEEIARMPDEERRKAAARVALGLAYGLDSNTHPGMSEELV